MRGKSHRRNTPTLRILSSGNEGRIPKSILRMAIVVVGVIATVSDIGNAQTFRKTKMLNDKGKEVSVDLCFDEQSKLLKVKPLKTNVADVPYGAIEKLSYQQAAHHRVRDGGGTMGVGCIDNPALLLTCPASLGVGAVLMFTKGKNHWFYVDYKQGEASKELTLKLEKSEYEQVLKTAREQTGKDVEILVSKKGKSSGKN